MSSMIKRVECNWNQDNGDAVCDCYEIGQRNVVAIDYHAPEPQDNKHYCDIRLADNTHIRQFNINSLQYLDPKIDLCPDCLRQKEFPECCSKRIVFGKGKGLDNIIRCLNYKK